MNKYERAYLNVDTSSCDEDDCRLLQEACTNLDRVKILLINLISQQKEQYNSAMEEVLNIQTETSIKDLIVKDTLPKIKATTLAYERVLNIINQNEMGE